MRKKGISNIIAVILLLIITIAMVSATWIWMKRVEEASKNKTREQINRLTGLSGQRIKIVSIVQTGSPYIRVENIGSEPIEASTVGVYINGSIGIGCSFPGGVLEVNAQGDCSSPRINGCAFVKVTTVSGEDSAAC